jgi:uncharacterized protein (DUF362 family)/Pyruvate/2-oxoacid:ferredoxin oxidoreductase delta subunit
LSTLVSIVKCQTYREDMVYQKVKEAIDLLGGIKNFVSPGEKILLKPNLAAGRPPEKCVTTHPLVVKAIALMVKEAAATPLIGDSPMLDSAQRAAHKSGIGNIARELGIDIVEFEPMTLQNPEGKIFRNFTIGKIIKEVDGVINIPKLKTHALTLLTLSIKNILGCVPGTRKGQWHIKTHKAGKEYFAQMLLDLNLLVNPVLNIVDGVIAMEGMGPAFGDPHNLGLIIAGTDGVAVDRTITEIVNVPHEHSPILRVAIKNGYGIGQLEKIDIVGEKLEDVRTTDFKLPQKEDMFDRLPHSFKKFLKAQLTAQPVINQEKCEACEMCLQACPMNVIYLENGRLKIDKNGCIQCLCCLEVCSKGAIDLKPGVVLNVFSVIRKIIGKEYYDKKI